MFIKVQGLTLRRSRENHDIVWSLLDFLKRKLGLGPTEPGHRHNALIIQTPQFKVFPLLKNTRSF
jgi:hypothetical protein